MFPNHELYVGKKVVKSLADIPQGEDKSHYIDKKTDILLRMKNVNENCDIVNWFFMKKFQLLVEHVFPVLKITDHIARSEFQGRGSIHIHAILVAEDVTPKDLEVAIKATQYPDDSYILQVDESTDGTAEKIFHEKLKNHNNIISSRNKVCDFAANHIGLTTLHPNANPNE